MVESWLLGLVAIINISTTPICTVVLYLIRTISNNVVTQIASYSIAFYDSTFNLSIHIVCYFFCLIFVYKKSRERKNDTGLFFLN